MSVYFVLCRDTDCVKIGFAEDAWKRFSKIQSDSPGELTMLAIIDGGKDREAELHRHFAASRRRGEWFSYSPEIQAHVAALPPAAKLQPVKQPKQLAGALGAWLADNGLSCTAGATLLGVSKATISQLCSGNGFPSWPMMLRIMELTGGQVMPNDFIPSVNAPAVPLFGDAQGSMRGRKSSSPTLSALET